MGPVVDLHCTCKWEMDWCKIIVEVEVAIEVKTMVILVRGEGLTYMQFHLSAVPSWDSVKCHRVALSEGTTPTCQNE